MRKILLLLVTLLAVQTSWSAPVSQRQALDEARKFFTAHGISLPSQAKGINAPQQSSDETAPWYAFNAEGNGFVIVSGDDRTEPVLGYSLTGSFSWDTAPDNMKAFLQSYADQITWLQKNNITVTKDAATRASDDKATIAPMLQTKWNQTKPYNNACPYFFSQSNGRCVTGCVATAMAQVLYYQYQQHPSTIVTQTQAEIPSYRCSTQWTGHGHVSVSAVPAGSVISWGDMLADYDGTDATDAQKSAVANLMLWCGAAVQMDYANDTNGGSSASVSNVPEALTKYFGFDASIQHISRDDGGYTTREWDDLVYNELAAGRVVLYGGQSAARSGHAFVINGYEGNNFFDINWGWGGLGDGAYLLSVLKPLGTGAGAGTIDDGYHYKQEIIINAEPDHGGTAALQATAFGFARNRNTLRYHIQNTGSEAANFDYGFGSVASDGTITVLGEPQTTPNSLYKGEYFSTLFATLDLSTLADGTYNIVPIAKLTSQTTWQSLWTGHSMSISVSGGNVTYLNTEGQAELSASSLATGSSLTAGKVVTVSATLSNTGTGDYEGTLYLFASRNGRRSQVASQAASVQAGSLIEFTVNWTPTAAGTYTLTLCSDGSGNNVLATLENVVIEEGNGQYAFTLTNMYVQGEDAASETVDADGRIVKNVTGSNLVGSYSMTANQSIASNAQFTTFIEKYNETTGQYDDYNLSGYPNGIGYSTYGVTLPSGYSLSMDFSFSNLPDGKYIIRPEVGLLQVTTYYYMSPEVWHDDSHAYIIGTLTGINGIKENSTAVTIYSINGMKVATVSADNIEATLNTLPAGIYIVNGKKVTVGARR